VRLHNLHSKKKQRRELRCSLTSAEALLWLHLQSQQLAGRKFRRQHSVGPFILDFYCPEERLAIELDGAGHDHERAQAHDAKRSQFLSGRGIRVVRFENRDVRKRLEGVLAEIAAAFRPR
jgi:very-short-patch-repair endonuclease